MVVVNGVGVVTIGVAVRVVVGDVMWDIRVDVCTRGGIHVVGCVIEIGVVV